MVADLRDLWAGHPYYDRGSPLLARLEGRALAQAAAVVTVTDGCRDNLLKLHPELAPRLHVLQERLRPGPLRATRREAGTPCGARNADLRGSALRRPHRGGADCSARSSGASRSRPARTGWRDRPPHAACARRRGDRRDDRRADQLGELDSARARGRCRRGDHNAGDRRRHGAADQAVRGARARLSSPRDRESRQRHRAAARAARAGRRARNTPRPRGDRCGDRSPAHRSPASPATRSPRGLRRRPDGGRYAALLDEVATRSSSATSSGTTSSRR